MLRSRRQIY